MRDIYPDSEILGILALERPGEFPVGEGRFVRELLRRGRRTGLTAIAFDPRTWDPSDDSVRGWTLQSDGEGWQSGRYGVPGLLYDRAWPETASEHERFRHALRRLEDGRKLRRLNGKLPHKGRVHALLAQEPELDRLLPPTQAYAGPASFSRWLDHAGGSAFLKPAGGSQGRRVAACVRESDGSVLIRGRRADNRSFEVSFRSMAAASAKLHRWIGRRSYIMQPLLDLTGEGGAPYDIRALVQKNGRGRWTVTGIAARIGRPGTVTANLHGGGRAEPAETVLAAAHGASKAEELLAEIRRACLLIVRRLERHCGRLAELGLDFGVDRSGRLWFLEANSKPGRQAMAGISAETAARSTERPIDYARFILLRPRGRVIHEFDHL
ncbi:YheC/YheD family protein [Cohnella candidum]|uniref:YheC/YheD family protein n=1 Tax=Cohnella candidum TaxID=2674991 RepID=A0A3G3JYD6_9BACL|nr:YheC/YheD family protein [Cohnella candidum]AYQ73254.1 YheC/YheD family protein [Cohnella candidum]